MSAETFPRVNVPCSVEPVFDFDNNRATFDLKPYVDQAMRRVDAAIEAGVVEILCEAFEAGRERGIDEHLSAYWGDSPEEPDFEEWLEAKRQEIRCQPH